MRVAALLLALAQVHADGRDLHIANSLCEHCRLCGLTRRNARKHLRRSHIELSDTHIRTGYAIAAPGKRRSRSSLALRPTLLVSPLRSSILTRRAPPRNGRTGDKPMALPS